MKLQSINKFLKIFGLVLVVKIDEQNITPIHLYIMKYKNFMKKTNVKLSE